MQYVLSKTVKEYASILYCKWLSLKVVQLQSCKNKTQELLRNRCNKRDENNNTGHLFTFEIKRRVDSGNKNYSNGMITLSPLIFKHKFSTYNISLSLFSPCCALCRPQEQWLQAPTAPSLPPLRHLV